MVDHAEVPNPRTQSERETYTARRKARLKDRPRLPALTAEEFGALLDGAEPATDDDVPWTFPTRTPVRHDSTA